MENPTQTVEEPVQTEIREETSPQGRVEHSLLSIVVIVLLSVGALYLAEWLLRDDGVLVHGWDFSETVEHDAWIFPGDDVTSDPGGATFEMAESGFGPELNLSISADDVRRMQASVTVADAKTGVPVPFALGWYWANSEDLAASPEEPFAGIRSMVFYPFARHRPNTYRIDLFKHKAWKGNIETGVFTIKFPENATGPFRVTFSRLEFLE